MMLPEVYRKLVELTETIRNIDSHLLLVTTNLSQRVYFMP